ncbi:MAG: DUF2752 domain-containing protein [Verrucomicrobiae bacterium]|nr:DUF2752 domain-containing protein [Verrucomicrobiae bacterium]
MNGVSHEAEFNEGGVPPRVTVPRRWSWRAAALVALAIAAGGAILLFFNPSQYGFYPVCHFYLTTGLTCTGCGSLRAMHQLLNGHFAEAFRLNALFVLTLAVGGWVAARFAWAFLRRQPAKFTVRTSWCWLFLAVALVFTVVRNLPAFAWLAP